MLSQSGRSSEQPVTGRRAAWAAEDERAQGGDDADWHPRWGNRAQELAWIGVDMDEPALRCLLSSCRSGACILALVCAPVSCSPVGSVNLIAAWLQCRAMLDGALLTDEETAAGPDAWAALDDPLLPWEELDEEDAAGA